MNNVVTVRKQGQWLAGFVASIANVLVIAALMGLADHYAGAGANAQVEAGSPLQQAATAASRNS